MRTGSYSLLLCELYLMQYPCENQDSWSWVSFSQHLVKKKLRDEDLFIRPNIFMQFYRGLSIPSSSAYICTSCKKQFHMYVMSFKINKNSSG